MTYSPVRNGAGRPLVVDRAGHVIGAGEFGAANVEQQPAKDLVEAGELVVVERPDGDVELDASAEAAFARVDALNAGDSSTAEAAPPADDLEGSPAVAKAGAIDTAPTTPKRGRAAASTTEA